MRAPVLALTLVLAIVFFPAGAARAATAPVPGVQWVRTLGSGTGRCIQQTADGGYLLTGWTGGRSGAGSDILLIKTDERGNKSWERPLHGNGYSCGYGLCLSSDGGAVVVGDTKSKTGYDHDLFVAKVDAGGNEVWEKNFGGRYCDYGAAVIQTGDGGYLVCGGTESYGAGLYDVYLLKLDGQGREIWERTYGGRGSDCGYALLQTPDGGYAVAGMTESTGLGKPNVYLFKTDGSGSLLWEKTYGGESGSYGWSLQQAGDGGYIIAGETEVAGPAGGGFKSYFVRTDAQGNRIWERICGGDSYGAAYAVWQAGSGDYLLAGKKEAAGGIRYVNIISMNIISMNVIETGGRSKAGQARTLADLGVSCAYAGQPTRDGGSIVAGEASAAAGGEQQVLLMKLAPDRSNALMAQSLTAIVLIPLMLLLACLRRRHLSG